MRISARSLAVALIVAAAILGAGCGDSLDPFEPELTSATDNFQLQATGVTDVTLTRTYSWANTGTRASINHSTTTSQGNTQLTIRDAAGAVVYSKALSRASTSRHLVASPGRGVSNCDSRITAGR